MKYLLIILLLLSSCIKPLNNTLRIKVLENWPIVKGCLNGKEAWFLLDTGASGFNLLNITDSSTYHFDISNKYQIIKGIGGYSITYLIENIQLNFNKTKINSKFISYDVDYIFDEFEIKTGINITGIIGSEVFIQYGAIINYKENTITFTK